MNRKPKPLVRVFQNTDKTWTYKCDRCLEGRWNDSWHHALEDGTTHANTHVGVGFSRVLTSGAR